MTFSANPRSHANPGCRWCSSSVSHSSRRVGEECKTVTGQTEAGEQPGEEEEGYESERCSKDGGDEGRDEEREDEEGEEDRQVKFLDELIWVLIQ